MWREIKDRDGNIRHLSTHTNTQTGRVRLFERDEYGDILRALDDFKMDHFDEIKQEHRGVLQEMNRPEQQQIDHWLKMARKDMTRKKQLVRKGFYEKENLPIQGAHTTMTLDHVRLARAKCFNGDTLASVRQEFAVVAKCIIKSFTMAYDPGAPDYVGDKPKPIDAPNAGYGQVSGSDVSEAIDGDGFNYALMAANSGLGRKLAHWYLDNKDGYEIDPNVNRYIYALKYAFLGETDRGNALLQRTIDEYTAKPLKDGGDLNYFTLAYPIRDPQAG